MSSQVLAAVIAASVGVLTLIGTVAVQVHGRRATSRDTEKTLDRTFAEQREQLDRTLAEQRTRTLNERFATAAGQLGDDKPPAVRLAGVYAMAGLADDWEENRQTCVDVLCAYLRMPYKPDPGDEAPEDKWLSYQAIREVRHTVIRVIATHLRDGAAVSWRGLDFDFTGAVFDGGDFYGAEFSAGTVRFDGAEFSGGKVHFSGTTFSGGRVSFYRAKFSGSTVRFSAAKFTGSTVNFTHAEFSGGEVRFTHAEFSDGEVRFIGASFSGSTVGFDVAKFSGSEVYFGSAEFSGGEVDFSNAKISGGKVNFLGATFSGGKVHLSAEFPGGKIDFYGAEFSGGEVDFSNAEFSGGEVYFLGATFSGGTVDFSGIDDWSFPAVFPWTDTPPPGITLPKKEDQSQA